MRAGSAHPRVDRFDDAFVSAASSSLVLLGRPEVAEGWDEPSVLPKMSVGALACHLGRQAARVAELVAVVTELPPLERVEEHYLRAEWVSASSPDDPPNDRSVDDAEALSGVAALCGRVARSLSSVRESFAAGTAKDVVLIPWQGWSLRRDDFLLTRLLEIVVHSDDLTLSVGIAPPAHPDAVFEPVADLLVRLAVTRHGQSALISTLARRERSRMIYAF